MFKKFQDELVQKLIKESVSLTEVCTKLGISTGGSSTTSLRTYIGDNNIDISHFKVRNRPQKREDYEKNPKLCKACGKPLPWEKRKNDFCDRSCSASYNNQGQSRNQGGYSLGSKLDNISDEKFIEILQNNQSWKNILTKFGYSEKTNRDIQNKIKDRASQLGVKLQIKEQTKRNWEIVTKKELFDYCSNWQSARTQIRKIAQKVFDQSGKECKCAICGYDKHIEIAHIKAVSDFNDEATIMEINAPKNLIGLCPNHHWEFDNGMLSEENLKIIQQNS